MKIYIIFKHGGHCHQNVNTIIHEIVFKDIKKAQDKCIELNKKYSSMMYSDNLNNILEKIDQEKYFNDKMDIIINESEDEENLMVTGYAVYYEIIERNLE